MKIEISNLLKLETEDQILWADNDGYNYFSAPTKIKGLITTSSWQRLALAAIDATYNDVIAPSIHEFDRNERVKRPDIKADINFVWAGNPSDGTVMMLVSILEALDIKYRLSIMTDTKIDSRTEAYIKENSKITVSNYLEKEFHRLLLASHVYATPSMSMCSFDKYAATAYASGCLVVAPNHSGYSELLSKFGFLSPYSKDNHLYASAFGAKILDAVSLLSNPSVEDYRRSQTGLCELMYEDTVNNKIRQFEEFMLLKDS